jgi:acyl-CoA thioester hydrolase
MQAMTGTAIGSGSRQASAPSPDAAPFSIEIRVYYEDTDAGAIVYYGNYLRYFERVRTEWIRSMGISQQVLMHEQQRQFVVRHAGLDFLAPARLDDVLVVSVRPVRLARTYVELEQLVHREGHTLCRGEVTIACIDSVRMKPAAIPQTIAARMKP